MSIFRRRPPTPAETRALVEAQYPPDTRFRFDDAGLPHCDDDDPLTPAIETPDGTRMWYCHGRLDSPPNGGPAVVEPDGYRAWYLGGRLHRTDGPAAIHPDGTELYYQHGHLHREDGPAVVAPGIDAAAWWLHGRHVTRRTHAQLVEQMRGPVQGPPAPDPARHLDEDFGISMVMDTL